MFNPHLTDVFVCANRSISTPPPSQPSQASLASQAAQVVGNANLLGNDSEEWKFASLNLLSEGKVNPSRELSEIPEIPEVNADNTHRLIFVNGVLQVPLSTPLAELQADSIQVKPLFDSEIDGNSLTQAFFESFPIAALSLYSASSPLHISIDGIVTKPLQLVFVGQGESDDETYCHHGHCISLELHEKAQCQLWEKHISLSANNKSSAYVHHDFLHIRMHEKSRLRHHKLQAIGDRHVDLGHAHVELQGEADYAYGLLHLGGRFARQDWHIHLCGEGSKGELYALALPYAKQNLHLSGHANHHSRACESQQLVKSIAAGGAKASYQGKIYIACGADESVAHQQSRGLLLDAKSEIDAKPELAIFADKVECAHGSAIGCLDADELFYLKARGIAEHQAYGLLLRAYIDEVALRFADMQGESPLGLRVQDFAAFLQNEALACTG